MDVREDAWADRLGALGLALEPRDLGGTAVGGELRADCDRVVRDSGAHVARAASTEAHQWASDPDMRERINLKLEEKGHDQNSVLARAYLRGVEEINAIDKRIAILESRRNKVLKEIGLRNERKAQKLAKAASDIIEGEYSEATD